MKTLHILSEGTLLDTTELSMLVESFEKFHQALTPKHQRRVKLSVRLPSAERSALLKDLLANCQCTSQVQVLDGPLACDESESGLFFFPSLAGLYAAVSEALYKGWPVMGFREAEGMHLVDASCGLSIKHEGFEHSCTQFAHLMRMIYFDPGARISLQKGAKRRLMASQGLRYHPDKN